VLYTARRAPLKEQRRLITRALREPRLASRSVLGQGGSLGQIERSAIVSPGRKKYCARAERAQAGDERAPARAASRTSDTDGMSRSGVRDQARRTLQQDDAGISGSGMLLFMENRYFLIAVRKREKGDAERP